MRILTNCLAIALVGCLFATAAADTILTFQPGPASPNATTLPELVWDSHPLLGLRAGAGAQSNSDGDDPAGTQTAPGLQLETPLLISDVIPGKQLNPNGTTFFDTSLILTGLAPAADATVFGGGLVQQLLGPGTFEFRSTDPNPAPGTDESVPLLSGSIDNGYIVGAVGIGVTLSASVTYTGGAIFDTGLIQSDPAGFSWSLLDVTPTFGVDLGTGKLKPFKANATGQFSAVIVPEPSAFLLVGALGLIGAGLLVLSRRRRHAV